MYFVISKKEKDRQFFSQTFTNETVWEDMVSKIKGETVVELFKNEILERGHFEDYFNFNYRRQK